MTIITLTIFMRIQMVMKIVRTKVRTATTSATMRLIKLFKHAPCGVVAEVDYFAKTATQIGNFRLCHASARGPDFPLRLPAALTRARVAVRLNGSRRSVYTN
jgi:hypothetical protein